MMKAIRFIGMFLVATVLLWSISAKATSFRDLPSGSTPAIVTAMLKDLPEDYQLKQTDKGYSMANLSHGMDIAFTLGGLQVNSNGRMWGMTLSGIGSPGSIKPVQQATLVNDNGRMVYERGELSEWYINSRWGIEQGFTIKKVPEGKQGLLVIELSVSGDLHPVLNNNTIVLTDAQGNSFVNYSGLQVFDADGKSVPAHLTLADRTLRIHVDDTHAKYPVTIDPWIQRAKLNAGDGAADDYFGSAIVISGDTIVVGVQKDDNDNGDDSGSAYIFEKPASGWGNMTHSAKLTAGDGAAGDEFGSAIAISGDTIVVGAINADINQHGDGGGAYVFTKPASGWSDMIHTAKLSSGKWNIVFGYIVGISGDTIIVVDPLGRVPYPGSGEYSGYVYVFVKPEYGWVDMTPTVKLTGPEQDTDHFGMSAAIDGDTVVVGSDCYWEDGQYIGGAFIFEKPIYGWDETYYTATLTSGRSVIGYFGSDVAISGNTIVVIASYLDSAYIFEKPASGWLNMTPSAKLTAGDGAAGDYFGSSVAISGDTIVVGASGDDNNNGDNSGSAYVFGNYKFPWRMFIPAITNSPQR